MAVRLPNELVIPLSELADFLLRCILGGGEQTVFVLGEVLEMLDLLLTIKHLPALNAKDLSVGLLLDLV